MLPAGQSKKGGCYRKHMKKKKRTLKKAVDPISLSITLLIIASLVLFNVLPLVKVLIQSFTDAEGTYSFGGYIRAFQFKQNRDAMVHTLVSSVSAAAIATVIGFIFCILRLLY